MSRERKKKKKKKKDDMRDPGRRGWIDHALVGRRGGEGERQHGKQTSPFENECSVTKQEGFFITFFYIFISFFLFLTAAAWAEPTAAETLLNSLHIKSDRVTLLFINHGGGSGGGTGR